MCQANDLAQRRHRAAYVAPSADLYPDTASASAADDDATTASLIPLLVEIPSRSRSVVSPPSSADFFDLAGVLEEDRITRGLMQQQLWKVKLAHSLKACYRWIRDIMAVVVMCVLGCFVYDIEVRVVKSNRKRARQRRVIVQNQSARRRQRPVRTTSLLRSPDDDRVQPWGYV